MQHFESSGQQPNIITLPAKLYIIQKKGGGILALVKRGLVADFDGW
jgi:hypothetical protein